MRVWAAGVRRCTQLRRSCAVVFMRSPSRSREGGRISCELSWLPNGFLARQDHPAGNGGDGGFPDAWRHRHDGRTSPSRPRWGSPFSWPSSRTARPWGGHGSTGSGFDASSRHKALLPDIHLYTRSGDDFDIRARMFAPVDGVPEDPATGSANCALAGLLRHLDEAAGGGFSWAYRARRRGMGRPSVLEARVEPRDGEVVERVDRRGVRDGQ